MKHTRVAAFLLSAALAGCGGSGGAGVTVPPQDSASSHGTASAQFTVVIPGAGSSTQSRGIERVRPNYVSENTESLTVAINGGTPFEYDLTATSSGCTQPGGSGTAVTCTESIAAPIGTGESWAFKTYSSAGGTGSVLAKATIPNITIAAGVANNLGAFTLNGVVGTYSLAWTTPAWSAGSSGSATLDLIVQDPSGAVIIAPGNYVDSSGNGVKFSLTDDLGSSAPFSDESWSYSLGTTSFTSPSGSSTPSNTLTISYGGLSIPSTEITVKDSSNIIPDGQALTVNAVLGAPSAAASCTSPDTCTGATGSIANGENGLLSFAYSGDTATIVASEPGWTTSPYDQSFSENDNCAASGAATVAATNANHWTVTAGSNVGGCTITLTDSSELTASGQTTLQFSVENTSTSVIITSDKRSTK